MITYPGSPSLPPLLLSLLPPLLPSPPLLSSPSPTGGKGSCHLNAQLVQRPHTGTHRHCTQAFPSLKQWCDRHTSFKEVVDRNCIPSTNSAHHSRKLSTNILTLHSSAYATPVVVQCNYDPSPPLGGLCTSHTQALHPSPSSQKQSGYMRPVTV